MGRPTPAGLGKGPSDNLSPSAFSKDQRTSRPGAIARMLRRRAPDECKSAFITRLSPTPPTVTRLVGCGGAVGRHGGFGASAGRALHRAGSGAGRGAIE